MEKRRNILIHDILIIAISVLIAVILAKTGAFKEILVLTKEIKLMGSFVAGIFFVSIFTTAPATVALAQISQSNSIILVSLLGGLGAMFGDLIIFRFAKNNLSGDLIYLSQKSGFKKFTAIFRTKFFRWVIPFIGALIVASPLPDELGLVLMGVSKIKSSSFILISFLLNTTGILIIGIISKSLN